MSRLLILILILRSDQMSPKVLQRDIPENLNCLSRIDPLHPTQYSSGPKLNTVHYSSACALPVDVDHLETLRSIGYPAGTTRF